MRGELTYTVRGIQSGLILFLSISRPENEDLPSGTTITTAAGKSAGKLICVHGNLGLALLRLQEMLVCCFTDDCVTSLNQCCYLLWTIRSGKDLFLKTPNEKRVSVSAQKPLWWPN